MNRHLLLQQSKAARAIGAEMPLPGSRSIAWRPVMVDPAFNLSRTGLVPEMRRIRRIHFVGIGGAGMSGIAEVLLNQGYKITGSDLQASATTARLEKLGATVYLGHRAENIINADVVVVFQRYRHNQQRNLEATNNRIPISPREMLAELMRYRHAIVIAGTHAKLPRRASSSLLAQGT